MAPAELGALVDAMLVVESARWRPSIRAAAPAWPARAANGDTDALAEVMAAVADARGR
jgi:hypothetical protein